MDRTRKKKERKITAQCIGIVFIVFALGLFVGNASNYQDWLANIISNQPNQVHVIHSSSEAAEHGAKLVLYTLGDEDNNNYSIDFDTTPRQEMGNIYSIAGIFTNVSDKHFTSVELNFSLLDKDGNKIGDTFAYCDGLNAGQTWKFSATSNKVIEVDARAVSAILDDIIITTL